MSGIEMENRFFFVYDEQKQQEGKILSQFLFGYCCCKCVSSILGAIFFVSLFSHKNTRNTFAFLHQYWYIVEIIIKMLSLCSGCSITFFYALSYNIYTTLVLYSLYCVGAVDERHYNIIFFGGQRMETLFFVSLQWKLCLGTMYYVFLSRSTIIPHTTTT